MPQMANIVVKAANQTTDVTYIGKAPSAGDTVPAIWRNESVGTSPSHFPEMRLTFRDSPDGQERRGRLTFMYPELVTDQNTSQTTVASKALAGVDFKLPKGMKLANLQEFAAQFGNLVSSTLIKSAVADGYSAT